MRKFYLNKMKSLAIIAFALTANVAVGQKLILTANGKPVSNNDVIELPCQYELLTPMEGVEYHYYEWNPHLEVATAEGTAELTVTVTSMENASGFQICWPEGCVQIPANESGTSKGTIDTKPVDIDVHKVINTKDPAKPDGGKIKVTLQTADEKLEVTVNCVLNDDNAVDLNWCDEDASAIYYTLEGIRIDNPSSKGMYIVRRGSKAKVMYKK